MTMLYRKSIAILDKLVPAKLLPFWNHVTGPKTVFFWAPVVKLGLVAAALGDLTRPANNVSIPQASSIAVTGFIWARYCLVIRPKLYPLCAVNLFVALTQITQVIRAVRHQQSLKPRSITSTSKQ